MTVCALSIIVSDYPGLSVKGVVDKWLEYLLMLVIVADVVVAYPPIVRQSVVALSFSAGLVILEALTQELFGKGLLRGYPLSVFKVMTGPYENPIDLATYLIVVIPILGSVATIARRRFRSRFLWVLLAALILCLARTEAFGAWLGLGASILVLSVTYPRLRRYGVALFAALFILGSAALIHTGHLGSTLSPREIGKVDRWVMWQAAIGMIRDRPLLGHGVNTFMANYLHYWVGGERQPRYAHNCYLQIAAETGLIGLALFLGILGCFFAYLISHRSHLTAKQQTLLLGFMGGLLAFSFHASIDTNFYALRQAALFWSLAGLALGLSSIGVDPTTSLRAGGAPQRDGSRPAI